jgi:iron complex outermembrane receptor protein
LGRGHPLACTLAVLLLAVVPRLPLAQGDRRPGVDAVVVSATRVDQPSLEVPASIDWLYGEDLREGRPQVNLSESLGRVPGIVVLNRQNYAQDLQISSRGFGARATFGVRGIRLIADGIPATMPDGQGQSATFDLGSASRVEVLRGPFSSMYGNASGGVINVMTEDGPAVPTVDLGVYAGSDNTWRGALKFGGQWGALNAVGNLSRFSTDGYRDHSATVRDQLNAKAKFALGSATGLTLVANSLRQPDTQDPLGLTRAQVEQNPQQATATAITFNTRKTIEHDQAGATLDHALSGATRLQASAWTGSRFVEQFLAIPTNTQGAATHSGGVVNLDRSFGGAALRVFNDAQLGGKALHLSAGVEYEQMNEHRRGFLNINGVQGSLKRDEDNVVSSTDLFAQAEWKFAERWSAHAGVRTSRVEFTSEDHFIVTGNADDSGARTYSATTPVAGIVYRIDAASSLYANLGRGFETPTFVELAYRNPPATGLNFALEPSRSRHFEAGYKLVKAGVARASAALFDVETSDEIVIDQSSGGRATFKNAGRTERRGLELGAESLLPGPFEARAALTYLSAEFRDGFATVTGTPAVPATVAAGNVLPGVPKTQLYAEAAWRHAPTGFRAAAELLYRDRVAVNDINSEFADAFTVLNLVFGFQQQAAKWRLSEFLRVDNVTDKAYIGSVVVNDANNRFYEPAPQRNILLGVQASLQF